MEMETDHRNVPRNETIHEIALKLVEEQLRLQHVENGPNERTVFIVGSNGVGKSTVVNSFLDRGETPKPTLALEYSYGRRTGHLQKQVLNLWELGSLENSAQLLKVPLESHGMTNFAAIIMLDLSQPQRLWVDLEGAYLRLLECCKENILNSSDIFYEKAKERIKKDHIDISTMDIMPFPIVIVGGKYDLFMGSEPELKKHICRCLRSMAHLIGASLLFYSNKITKLSKTLRDTISHLGFGSPSNPFRVHTTDYNDALSIWFGNDTWNNITAEGALDIQRIHKNLTTEVTQMLNSNEKLAVRNPSKDPGFRESIIDGMRAQKDDELQAFIKESQVRGKFETVLT